MLDGATTLPFELDILAPSRVIIPCVNSEEKGSLTSSRSMSVSALQKKRAYSRGRIACSTPPLYRWREMSQSCRRQLTERCPLPCWWTQATIAPSDSPLLVPSNWGAELVSGPSPV